MPRDLKKITRSVTSSPSDVKAEVIIADLLQRNIAPGEIVSSPEGTFRRNYGRDVIDCFVDYINDKITLRLSREGIYDILPEGLFHDVALFSKQDVDERKKTFEKQKKEETSARRFFMPLDNELIFARALIEREVTNIMDNPLFPFRTLMFSQLQIPSKYYPKLISFLPFTNEIKGNIELTARCLEEILQKRVLARKCHSLMSCQFITNRENIPGGGNILGENFTINDRVEEEILRWEFRIIIENEEDIEEYADPGNESVHRWIGALFDFFVPFEIETVTLVECIIGKPFILGHASGEKGPKTVDVSREAYLGLNTTI